MNHFSNFFLASLLTLAAGITSAKDIKLLNVSYDPTREFYAEVNREFAAEWKAKTGAYRRA